MKGYDYIRTKAETTGDEIRHAQACFRYTTLLAREVSTIRARESRERENFETTKGESGASSAYFHRGVRAGRPR